SAPRRTAVARIERNPSVILEKFRHAALATVCALVTVSLVGHAFEQPGLAVEHQPPRQWRFVEESRRPGTHFGTFQSYQPSFAFAGGALYKSYLTDETTEANQRSLPTTLHIARLADGEWSDIWTDSGLGFDPACLIGDGDTLYAAVANYMD